jgi:hypothetical protein
MTLSVPSWRPPGGTDVSHNLSLGGYCARLIENTLHWQWDVSFREDECRVYRDHAPANLSVIRRFALGLLKRDKSCRRGIETKRLKCAASDEYLEKVLFNTSD